MRENECGLVRLGVVIGVEDAAFGKCERVQEHVATLRKCGPQAVATAKALIRDITPMAYDQAIEHAVKTITRVRTSPEGQEGLGAFLEKRRPAWADGDG